MRHCKTIVQINTVAVPHSGVGNVMHGIHRMLKSKGFRSLLIAGYGPRKYSDLTLQNRIGYYLNAIKARLQGNDGFGAVGNTRKLINYLDKINPDIVHLHNAHGYYLNMPLLSEYLLNKRIPLVVTAHDPRLCTGRCAIPLDCYKWQNCDCDSCNNPARYPGTRRNMTPNYLSRYIGVLNAHIVTPSETVARLFAKSTLAHLPVSVIPNGIDKTVFRFAAKKKDNHGMKLLAVATKWDENKNPDALRRLVQTMPNDWHLTIVGQRGRRKIGGSSSNVTFIKHIDDNKTLAGLYHENDVFLSPSHWETFSTTVLEAISSGTPSVVRYLPHIAGVFQDSFEDPEPLIITIMQTAKIKPDPNKVASIECMAEAYLNLYERILDSSNQY